MNPLAQAIDAGDLAACRDLLTENPQWLHGSLTFNPKGRSAFDGTPLHAAVFYANRELIDELIARGADVDARNAENRTPLHVALEFSNQVRDQLISHGAQIDVVIASCLGDLEKLKLILEEDPSAATDTTTDLSPLGWAAYHAQAEAARMLLLHGADPNDGALICAASVNAVEVGQVLLEAGADPNRIVPGFEAAALHAAATQRYTRDASAFVSMLLNQPSIDAHLPLSNGMTALDIARRVRDRVQDAHKEVGFARIIQLLENA